MKIGDRVLILPELKKYIERENWSDQMYNLIGKKHKIMRTHQQHPACKKLGIHIFDCQYDAGSTAWFIPDGCYESMRIRKIKMILDENR